MGERDTVLGTTTSDSSGKWSLTVALSDGTHSVTASQTDLAGNTGTATTDLINAPAVTGLTITGLAQEGQTLMASTTPGESDDILSYQWYSAGNAITGATGATFVAREVDEGNQLSVTATVVSADQTATASASASSDER